MARLTRPRPKPAIHQPQENRPDAAQIFHSYAAAADALEQALHIYRDIGDKSGEANAFFYLGIVRHCMGDLSGATRLLKQALTISRSASSRLVEANALGWLADAQRETGDFPGAAQGLDQALEIYRRMGSRLGEANALYWLGGVRQATSDFPGAVEVLRQSLGIYRDIGDRLGEANVLCLLADALQAAGSGFLDVAELLVRALSIYADIGDRLGEAEALNKAGAVHLIHGDPQQARVYHLSALKLARAVDNQLEEARALEGIGKCSAKMATGTDSGDLRQALEIYRGIGAADALRLAAEMNDSPPGSRHLSAANASSSSRSTGSADAPGSPPTRR